MDLKNEITRLKRIVYFLQRKLSGGGGGGASAFTDLTDVPNSYSGEAGKVVTVNGTEDGLEFTTAGAGSGDVVGPASATSGAVVLYDGTTGKLIKNSTILPTTVGIAIANLANPSAVTFIRINADNSVTARSASQFLDDIYSGYTSDSTPLDTDEIFSRDTVSNLNLRTTLLNLWTNYLNGKVAAIYAPLASPTFTGTPAAPTASALTNTTQLATTAFVQQEIYGQNSYIANKISLQLFNSY